jgi:hypothetical protein
MCDNESSLNSDSNMDLPYFDMDKLFSGTEQKRKASLEESEPHKKH